MPWVDNETWEQVIQDNTYMSGELARYEALGSGVIELARLLKAELMAPGLMEDPTLDGSTVAEIAYRRTYEQEYEKAFLQRVADYQNRHRAALYQRVIEEIDLQEGPTIYSDVRAKIESDPHLNLQLKESARAELATRALAQVKGEITEEQQQIIDRETERQLGLERLDVRFAADGELDLVGEDVVKIVKPGDTLILSFDGWQLHPAKYIVEWVKDARGNEGWKFVSCDLDFYDRYGNTTSIPQNKFVLLGTILPEMTSGTYIAIPGLLKRAQPLVTYTKHEDGSYEIISTLVDSGGQGNINLVLRSIDFRTRLINFVESES